MIEVAQVAQSVGAQEVVVAEVLVARFDRHLNTFKNITIYHNII